MPRLSKVGAAALAAFGWTGISSVTVSYLVVAGGGGGGTSVGGGGGAGGYLTGSTSLNPTLSYTVTVGAGGAGSTNFAAAGTSGSNSEFNAIASTGGGGGGSEPNSNTGAQNGLTGGSGGGGGSTTTGVNGTGGTATSGQGNAGAAGSTNNSTYRVGGGGGGAGSAGSTGTTSPNGAGGAGGSGTASSISGASVTYAGGGGGSPHGSGTAGAGGSGGGGNSGTSSSATGVAGTANLGGGGGAGGNEQVGAGGAGGSGVVIISYPGAQQFGGGVVTTDGTNTIHTFTTSGTLSVLVPLTASTLVVAGGGGGSGGNGGSPAAGAGGGGAGGYRTSSVAIDINSNYVVTVGAGGAAGPDNGLGVSGSDSAFFSTTSTGGGRGGSTGGVNGATGGSGGGGQGKNSGAGGAGNTPSTSPSQGSNGGAGGTSVGGGGGGGGGATATGTTATSASGGAGGAGTASSLSGASVTYAGGGGGGNQSSGSGGTGGSGGGGAGGTNAAGTAGTANLGGGGGGGGVTGSNTGFAGGAGGSGTVIISYPGATQQMAGGTVTISGGNVIHTFTSSGYLTPIKFASRSLRTRASASAYLNRTFGSTGNTKTWTWSGWVKRGVLGTKQNLFGQVDLSVTNRQCYVSFETDNTFSFVNYTTSGFNYYLRTTQVFRDPSAWYHIVVVSDTTQATAANRLKMYINGVQVTAFGTATYPSQNFDGWINANAGSGVQLGISRTAPYDTTEYFDGYQTEINFIDGAALTPSSFGTFNSFGVWQPITYGGSYGTNGFYLTFGDNTSTTTLGYDTSPQGNNWTTNNISVTAGTTYDSMTDVPTLTSATAANYCVLNPLDIFGGTWTLTNGNLTGSSSSVNGVRRSTVSVTSGKWYWEVTIGDANQYHVVGVSDKTCSNWTTGGGFFYAGRSSGGALKADYSGTTSAYGASFTTNDVIGVALDMDNGTLVFYKNNTNQGTAFSTNITGKELFPTMSQSFAGTCVDNYNFGQQPFTYTPPTGFVALNTYNLSTPTIPNGAVYFAATTYTGTGASLTVANTVNGTAMQPDWVWVKGRSGATDHALYDAVRGVQNQLESNTTTAETTETTGLTAFGTTGFTIGALAQMNTNAATYVGWQWNAGGSTVTNTSGTISAQVRANTTAGFSVVTASASGTSPVTIGHGLGVAPKMIIGRVRNNTANWYVYNGNFSASDYLVLNTTAARATSSNIWDTAPTSTVFTVGNPQNGWNGGTPGSYNYVFYCFAEIAGYSAFGSYTGNGSTDGPFVFLGFRPRWVMFKRTDSTDDWIVFDTSRNTYDVMNSTLFPNGNYTETTDSNRMIDSLSNGFKVRSSPVYINASGGTYIYMAFAENPFKYSNAR